MEVLDKRQYYNSINEAIIVNADSSTDPAGLGRVQIYIPNEHIQYSEYYEEYMDTSNKTDAEGFNMFPWAITLVKDLKNGNVVMCGTIENNSDNFVIIGLDVNNPANAEDTNTEFSPSGIGGLVDLAMPIIILNETSSPISAWPDNIPKSCYTNINPQDKDGWSIGLLQWHHTRAFDCLYAIAKEDTNWKDNFTDKSLDLCNDLQKSLNDNSSAKYRTKYQSTFRPSPGSAVYKSITNMLGSKTGKKVQRDRACDDVGGIMERLITDYGVNNPAILIWLADILNQYGEEKTKTKQEAGKVCKSKDDMIKQLDTFRTWCSQNLGNYNEHKSRRDRTYDYLVKLYKEGKLNFDADATEMLKSKYLPEYGDYLWPVKSSDKINCFWGTTSDQAKYISGRKKGQYNWGGLWHSSPHGGIDIAPKKAGVAGDECYAIGNGVVTRVQTDSPDSQCGYYVAIKLDNVAAKGYPYVIYMHFCKQSKLKVGDRVVAGKTVVGYMGTTGHSTGVHLHIQLNKTNTGYGYAPSTDILPYLGRKLKSAFSNGKGNSLLSSLYGTSSTNSKGKEIIEYAKTFIGTKYVWGGNGPNSFDCSGFVKYVYKHFGYDLPRTTDLLVKKGTEIITKKSDYKKLQEADLLHFSGHIGMYIGNNEFIHASNPSPYPKGGVKISTFTSYTGKSFIKATRILK